MSVGLYRKKTTVIEAEQVRCIDGRWNMADVRGPSPLSMVTWQLHPNSGHTGDCNDMALIKQRAERLHAEAIVHPRAGLHVHL